MIRTERLRLIPCDEALLRAIVAGSEAAARLLGVVIPAHWPKFPEAYVLVDDKRGALIGSGGFAGRPSPEGIVELGYETAPLFRGRGWRFS